MNYRALVTLTIVIVFVGLTRIVPLLRFDARPGGDANLAVYWGNEVLATDRAPEIERAWEFNEQPRDYDRPLLYIFSSLPSTVAGIPIVRVIGWLSIIGALGLIGLTAMIAYLATQRWQVGALAAVLGSLSVPWYRYIFPAGYHFQNIFGELLVLLVVFLTTLVFVYPKRVGIYLVLVATIVSTLFFHQLSTFVLVLYLMVVSVVSLWLYRRVFFRNRKVVLTAVTGLLIALAAGLAVFGSQVYWEVRSFMTPDPKFLSQVQDTLPVIASFAASAIFGVLGVILAWKFGQRRLWPVGAFLGVIVVTMIGPLYGFNVPPTRVSNYLVAPLVIFAAVGIDLVTTRYAHRRVTAGLTGLLAAAIVAIQLSQYTTVLATNSKNIPTSSQLTVREELIAGWLRGQPAGKVAFDYDVFERGIWLMPLTGRYVYSASAYSTSVLGPYTDDPSIARKVANDEQINRLFHDRNASDAELLEILHTYQIRFVVTTSTANANFATRPIFRIGYRQQGVYVYAVVEPTTSR